MTPRDGDPHLGLSAEEFGARFQQGARVLWTLAAGLLGDPVEAEDVCQEAFLVAHAKREQFDVHTDFLAWMGSIVRNLARNEHRKRQRRRTTSTDPVELDARPGTLAPDGRETASLLDGFDARLLAALRALGEVPRACLLLRSLHELSYAEVADLLAIPEGTAMSHVHRARQTLRARLDPTQDPART